MTTLQSLAVAEALCQRIQALRPDLQPRWGTLSVGAMICHLYDGCQIGLGHLDGGPPIRSIMGSAVGRWLVIRSPMPWPKGKVAAPPAFLSTTVEDFHTDRQRLLAIIQQHARHPGPWGVSPIFGQLSGDNWQRLQWRHCNHHLRQFGC